MFGNSRLVSRVERDVGWPVLFYLELRAMACGKEDPGRDEGARAHGEKFPLELRHIGSHVGMGVRPPVWLTVYDGLCHPVSQQDG
jgi:hypothetical protein